eukprot:Nitzschia sp. Nitz4//scaffold61_size107673//45161//46305//NITZ4_004233-RA/size107673-snap-gene-0.111-mRNA-1//-1//CDS//3329555704//643//frame0
MRRKRTTSRQTQVLIAIIVCIYVNQLLSWFAGFFLPFPQGTPVTAVVPIKNPPPNKPKPRPRQTMPPRTSSHDSVGFVHVGKTGGSTISKLLRNGCTSFVKTPCRNISHESVVSKMVEQYYHVPDFHRLPSSNHKKFIISVRDVYERTVSSYLYHHPKNAAVNNVQLTVDHANYGPLAYSCFETLEAFASLMRGNTTNCNYPYRHNVVDANDCSALACATLHGKVRFFVHLFFNFRNILYTKLPKEPPREFYVIRQEHLWDDWKNVNVEFGQHEPVFVPNSDFNQRNTTGLVLPVSRDVSDDGRVRLCEALELEYVAYFQILKSARNLNSVDLQRAVEAATKSCPNLDFQSMLR